MLSMHSLSVSAAVGVSLLRRAFLPPQHQTTSSLFFPPFIKFRFSNPWTWTIWLLIIYLSTNWLLTPSVGLLCSRKVAFPVSTYACKSDAAKIFRSHWRNGQSHKVCGSLIIILATQCFGAKFTQGLGNATCSLNQFHVCANFMLLCSTVIFLVTEKGKTNTTFALENVYRWRGGGEDVDYYVRVERAISHKGGFEQNLTEYGRSSSQIETGDQNAVKENNHSVLTITLLLISLWCTNIRQWRWLLIITANRASFQIQFSCSKIITYLLHTDTDRPEC